MGWRPTPALARHRGRLPALSTKSQCTSRWLVWVSGGRVYSTQLDKRCHEHHEANTHQQHGPPVNLQQTTQRDSLHIIQLEHYKSKYQCLKLKTIIQIYCKIYTIHVHWQIITADTNSDKLLCHFYATVDELMTSTTTATDAKCYLSQNSKLTSEINIVLYILYILKSVSKSIIICICLISIYKWRSINHTQWLLHLLLSSRPRCSVSVDSIESLSSEPEDHQHQHHDRFETRRKNP